MIKKLLCCVVAVAALASCAKEKKMPWDKGGGDVPEGYEVGKALPGWSEGEMDIHAINSARGECTFIIMPDGTTMLIDAGELYKYTNSSYNNVPARPDAETRPTDVYGSYILHYMPKGSNSIDYFNLSHYHIDHMGTIHSSFGKDSGGYTLVGPSAIYSKIPFKKLIDRSYPDYNISGADNLAEYKKFVEYCVKNRGMVAEKCKVGSTAQVVLTKTPSAYPSFKVTCLAGSGQVYDGKNVISTTVAEENALSVAWMFQYGKFEYYTSGDANNGATLKPLVGGYNHGIEAMKCHHHMSNTGSFKIENDVFRPKVVVTQSFYVRPNQPHQDIITGKIVGQDMFFTNIDLTIPAKEGTTVSDKTIAPLDASKYGNCTASNGHVVIRVASGGDSFMVYMLDDTDTKYKIKSIHGPYTCN